jgi:hypothetical protein
MLVYRVTYAHDNENSVDDQAKHGYAMQEVQVDHEVTTKEDLIEIARQIGTENGYTSVGIVKIELAVEDDEEEDLD